MPRPIPPLAAIPELPDAASTLMAALARLPPPSSEPRREAVGGSRPALAGFTGFTAQGDPQTFETFCRSADFAAVQAQLQQAWAELSDQLRPTGHGGLRLAQCRRDLIDPPPTRADPPERGYLFGFGKRWLDDLLVAWRHPALDAGLRDRGLQQLTDELNAGHEPSGCFARALTRLRIDADDPLERQAEALRKRMMVRQALSFMKEQPSEHAASPRAQLRHAAAAAHQMLQLMGLLLEVRQPVRHWCFDATPEMVNRCDMVLRSATSPEVLAAEWIRRVVSEVADDLASQHDGSRADAFDGRRAADLKRLETVLDRRHRRDQLSASELVACRGPDGGGHLLRAPGALAMRFLDRITERGLALADPPQRLATCGDGQVPWTLHHVGDHIAFVQDDRLPGRPVRQAVHLDDLEALDRRDGDGPTAAFAASLTPGLRRLLAQSAQSNEPVDSARRPAAWWTAD